jgi:hypothetical protein
MTSKNPLKTDSMMINKAVPTVTPAMLMRVSTDINDTRFFEKRYRLAMFLVTSTSKDTH